MKTKQLLNVVAAWLTVRAGALAKGVGFLLVASAAVTSVAAGWTLPESSVTPPGVVTLDPFGATDLNGFRPQAALVVGPDGALYGSASEGGSNKLGTLFRLTTNGEFTKLHDFKYTDGTYPYAALTVGPDSAMYGLTGLGGTNGAGTLFKLETNGTFTKLHDVPADGAGSPWSPALVVGRDGALYGPLSDGGPSHFPFHFGSLFRLETNGALTILHEFSLIDGAGPYASLVVGPDGALYGSTLFGGANRFGTLFRLATDGTFTTLHDFTANDGLYTYAALVAGSDGALYGSAFMGGVSNVGTLFRVTTNGEFTKLHDFTGNDGSIPYAALVAGSDGALYGSAPEGGTIGGGTLFRLATDGTFTQLHDFTCNDGCAPYAALVAGSDGAMYGSTSYGGTNGAGTLFRLKTDGTFTHLYDFDGTGVFEVTAAMVLGPDAALYGSHPWAGPDHKGVLFKLILDSDGDGVPDSVDQCPGTPVGTVVNVTGCSIGQLVPCSGPATGGAWKNHGEYVSTVVKTAQRFLAAGLITKAEMDSIVATAAQSDCGKKPKESSKQKH